MRSEIKEALRGFTSELVGDLTQEIRAKPEPLILPQASPTIVGVSPHRVQAVRKSHYHVFLGVLDAGYSPPPCLKKC